MGKSVPHDGCRELGPVTGKGGGGDYTRTSRKLEKAQLQLRTKAAAMGGDFVVMDIAAHDYIAVTITGRAFDCSQAPAAAPVPVTIVEAPSAEKPVEERLRKLDELKASGLISDEEYAERRQAILDSI
ncbi:MAG: DUF4156 domain-containing protein [Polyangiales bacterium]